MKNNAKKLKVSIIMNCHNSADYLKEAIDSIYAQIYTDWEIIFWDNMSTDQSATIAKNYDEKLRYFKGEEFLSLGEARNKAIEQAEGDYIAFLDCDDIWLPQKLEKQMPIFNNDSKIGLVFSDAIYFNQKGKVFQLFNKKKPAEGYIFRQLLENYFLCLPTVVIKKETLIGLREWFDNRFNYIEEADLFLRIAHDWKIAYVDEILAKYRMHKGSWTFVHKYSFSNEGEALIKKFLDLYPNFSKEYSNELKTMQAQINCEKFFLYWKNGDKKRARQYLKPFIRSDKRMLLLYVFSYFFPFSFYSLLLPCIVKRRYSP